jgi:2-polyprenyl-3-methyl-5-hydroxy-6-metoxy-1,4-benzoquinol methylase
MFSSRGALSKIAKFSLKSATRIISERLADRKATVLDFGCGPKGSFTISRNAEYESYDIDRNNKFATYHKLSQIRKVYDVVVLSHVIEHMPPLELDSTLKWLSAHARKIIIATPNGAMLNMGFYDDLTHVRPYSSPDFLFLLSKRFGITEVRYCGLHTKNPLRIFLRSLVAYAYGTYPVIEVLMLADNRKKI